MKLQKDDKWLKDARDLILAKFPALGSTMSRLDILSTNIPTAATDNNKIYYSKEFLQNLTTSEQAFILAHEVMHVEFEHIQRTLGRDKKTWNIATDAVINQLLINAGLDIPVGCVNMPDAINKSAEDMYQYLLGNPSKVEEIFNGKGAEKECENGGIDDHSNWVEIAEREVSENEKEGGNQSSFSKVDNDINPNKIAHNTDKDKKEIEKEFAQKNEDMKNDLASNMRESLSRFAGNSTKKETFAYGSIRNEKPVLNWKKS